VGLIHFWGGAGRQAGKEGRRRERGKGGIKGGG